MIRNQDFKLWNYSHDESLERSIRKNNRVNRIHNSLLAKKKEMLRKSKNSEKFF